MTLQEMELKRVEEYIMKQFSPIVRTFILNSPKVNKVVDKYEKLIMSYMDDTGKIDGELLNIVLSEAYPELTKWIVVPNYKFYLKDECEKIMSCLMKNSN